MVLLNRDFQMPADGWYQLAPVGEFAHAQAGLIQVVDREACEAMVNRFREEAKAGNFAGVLVDFDHFSLDGEKRSEAAGWITALEARCQNSGEDGSHRGAKDTERGEEIEPQMNADERRSEAGLWAKIRWSDLGEEAVKGGRYRFLSPVWARSDCVDLGDGRVRPVRLLNAAVTNDPNLKGMRPLSNRGEEGSHRDTEGTEGRVVEQKATKGTKEDKGGGEKRFKWVFGVTESGKHCPSCAAVAGQVHTMAEWEAAGVKPGAGSLFCQGNCRCRLVETNEPRKGDLSGGPRRKKAEMENRERRARLTMGRLENRIGVVMASFAGARGRRGIVKNTGWTDEARIAALAVRKAKAGLRGKVEKKKPVEGEKPPDVFAGGTPYFDERTGKYVYPPEMWAPPGGVPGLPGGRVPVAGVVPKGRPPRLKHPYVPPGYKGWM